MHSNSSEEPDTDTSENKEYKTIDERVAVLEHLTHKKPKGIFDNIKEWGGIISLLIAVAYSFPLGIWDRFVVSPEKAKANHIQTLRDVIAETSKISMDAGTSLSTIQDPTLRDLVGRAATTRVYLLMQNNKEDFLTRKKDFSATEALVIGYNFLGANQHSLALMFFQQAALSSGDDLLTKIEALRFQGKTLFLPSEHQDVTKAREIFSSGVELVKNSYNLQLRNSVMTLYADWGMLELADGDWDCGLSNINQARSMYSALAPYLNDNGNFLKIIDSQLSLFKKNPNKKYIPC